jgi:protein-export membrane protein SecD
MFFFTPARMWAVLAVCILGALLCLPNFVPQGSLPSWVPHRTVNLGLDLRGGSYLLLEVDLEAVVRERLDSLADGSRTALNRNRIGFTGLAAQPAQRRITLRLREVAQAPDALRVLRELANPITTGMGTQATDLEVAATPDGQVTVTLSEAAMRDKATDAIQQSIEIVRRRIDESGVVDPVIARQGANRILVQLPGVEDPNRIKELLGRTARMTFRLLDDTANLQGTPPPGVDFLRGDGAESEQRYAVRRRVEVDGANLTDARAAQDPRNQQWVVNFTFDSIGARRFAEVTRNNVGRPFAIVLDDRVISAPRINEPITGGRGQISGSFNARTANDLAVLLRAGALPAPLTVVEERSVGPELGADAIRAGMISLAVGFVLVVAYMATAYGLFGWFANIAMLVNLVLTMAVLSLMGATLTLPGLAGLVLSLGTAVDANILINERIREEVKAGRTPVNAIEVGYRRAGGTVWDSNLTNVIAFVLLYIFGSGPVRGFAVTATVGVLTSLFTATMLVKLMMFLWYRRGRPAALPV